MIKFRVYFDKDKETKWLNEMAAQGFAATGFSCGFYRFSPCGPQEYIYQIDMTPGWFRADQSYREFMDEMGIEIVALWGRWVILRKKAADGPFELYTDAESRIEHYRNILTMFKLITVVEIIGFMIEVYGAVCGSYVGMAGMAVVGLFMIVMMCATWKTKEKIRELSEQAGKSVRRQKSAANGLILSGMFINVAVAGLQDSISDFLRGIFLGLAIVLMTVGLIQIIRSKDDGEAGVDDTIKR